MLKFIVDVAGWKALGLPNSGISVAESRDRTGDFWSCLTPSPWGKDVGPGPCFSQGETSGASPPQGYASTSGGRKTCWAGRGFGQPTALEGKLGGAWCEKSPLCSGAGAGEGSWVPGVVASPVPVRERGAAGVNVRVLLRIPPRCRPPVCGARAVREPRRRAALEPLP